MAVDPEEVAAAAEAGVGAARRGRPRAPLPGGAGRPDCGIRGARYCARRLRRDGARHTGPQPREAGIAPPFHTKPANQQRNPNSRHRKHDNMLGRN